MSRRFVCAAMRGVDLKVMENERNRLKLVLNFGYLKMDLPQHDVGMVNSITLNPQQIPIDVKVVLLGSRDLYYTLQF